MKFYAFLLIFSKTPLVFQVDFIPNQKYEDFIVRVFFGLFEPFANTCKRVSFCDVEDEKRTDTSSVIGSCY